MAITFTKEQSHALSLIARDEIKYLQKCKNLTAVEVSSYKNLLRSLDSAVSDFERKILQMPDAEKAWQTYNNSYGEMFAVRLDYKEACSKHDELREFVTSEKNRLKNQKRWEQHKNYRLKILRGEFGEKVYRSNGKYWFYPAPPEMCVSRIEENQHLTELLRTTVTCENFQQIDHDLQQYYCNMGRRLSDCRHVLALTWFTDKDESRSHEAFGYLYEALTFGAEILAARAKLQKELRQNWKTQPKEEEPKRHTDTSERQKRKVSNSPKPVKPRTSRKKPAPLSEKERLWEEIGRDKDLRYLLACTKEFQSLCPACEQAM